MLYDGEGNPRVDLGDIDPSWKVGDERVRRITYKRGSVLIEWVVDPGAASE